MPDFDEYEATFAVEGGIFGVGRLATRLKQLSDTDIGQWIDFHHTGYLITAWRAPGRPGRDVDETLDPRFRD